MTTIQRFCASSFPCIASLLALASADVITPASVVSATAASDFLPASTLINGSGLSSSVLTERTLHTVTHADAASAFEGWVTDFFEPEYFDSTSTLPAPTLTFELPGPTTIDGFAYWGYLYEGSFEGNEAKAFTLSFFDASGAPLGSPQTLESSELVGPNVNVCSLTPVSNVKTITLEITDNFYPASGGERVGLSEVRFLGSEAPGFPLAAESSLGAGGTNGHDPYFGDYGQTVRLDQGNVVAAFSVRDNSSALPESADGEGYGCFFRVYLPDGSSVTGAPVAPYLDINPAGTGWQSHPLLAPLANGDFAIAWSSSGGPGDVGPGSGFSADGDAYVRVFQADGTPRSGTVKVNESEPTGTDDDQGPVAIVALTGGGFAIVWGDENNNTGNSDDYFVRAFSSTGTPTAASIQLGGATHEPFFQDFSDLVALDHGGFAASWRTRDDGLTPSPDGDRYGAFFQTFTAAGAADSAVIAPYTDINPSGTGGQNTPGLTALSGGLAVTWNSAYGPGDVGAGFNANNGGDTYVRVFTNSGTSVSSTTKVNDLTDQWQDFPVAITTLGNGHFAIAWQDGEDSGGPNEDDLFVRSFSPTGVATGPSVQLGGATHEALFQDFGNLIALDDDGFAACWRTRDSDNDGTGTSADGEGFGAFLQVFNADGTARSALIIPYLDLNPAGTGSQNGPILTALPGGLAATWNSAYGPGDTGNGSNSNSGGDAYARAFDNQGVAVSPTSKAHNGDPTGTVDVQFPLSITASNGSYAVVLRDDNENTDNKDDFFIRFFSLPADPLLADFNGDDLTDFEDLILLREVIASGGGAGQPAFDLNGDTTVDLADLDAFFSLAGIRVRTVTSADDAGNGTLRKIIDGTNPGSRTYIPFAAGMSGGQLLLTSGELEVDTDIFVDGSALPDPPVLDGAGTGRIFSFQSSGQNILDSLVLTNGSADNGGAILRADSDLVIRFSTLSGNAATNLGGAINCFGNGSLAISHSTLADNTATDSGGAIMSFDGNLSISNSTIAENETPGQGSSIWAQGSGTLVLEQATISANSGSFSLVSFLPTTIENSIITGNSPNFFQVPGDASYLGVNLISGDPLLAALADYGGATATMIPLPGSPALDRIPSPSLAEDQRLLPRFGDADVGAAEYTPTSDLPLIWDSDFDGDGTQFGAELALGSNPNLPDAGSDKRLAPPLIDPSGDALLSFGWDSTAPQGTRWVLKRSTDLLTFTPIFRYDGDSVVLGSETETTFDIINGFILYEDQDAPAGKAFYRFEAEFQPGTPQ